MSLRMFGLALSALTVFFVGCASQPKMAFEKPGEVLTATSHPVYLMTVTLKNDYKNSFQPRLQMVQVVKKDGDKKLNFRNDDVLALAKGNTYHLRMQLEPGAYEIRGFSSSAFSFPIMTQYFAPLHASVEAQRPGVIYLGNVTATIRERKGNEFKAGPSVPLIDQAVGGASGGTFDVVISDKFATDEVEFRNRYPALKSVTISKNILPPFDREKAQRMWEASW